MLVLFNRYIQILPNFDVVCRHVQRNQFDIIVEKNRIDTSATYDIEVTPRIFAMFSSKFGNLNNITKLLNDFCASEKEYIAKLERIQIVKYNLKVMHVPEKDLEMLFGLSDDILELHKSILFPKVATICSVQELVQLFAAQTLSFKIYIYDQWLRGRGQITGADVFERKFKIIGVDIKLPEQRIKGYLQFFDKVKATCKNSQLYNTIEGAKRNMTDVLVQIQYAKDLARAENLPKWISGSILLVNTFEVKRSNEPYVEQKVYCFKGYLLFISETAEKKIFKDVVLSKSIGLNALENDDMEFHITVYPTSNCNYRYVSNKYAIFFKARNKLTKTLWVSKLQELLLMQVEEEKIRLTNFFKKVSCKRYSGAYIGR